MKEIFRSRFKIIIIIMMVLSLVALGIILIVTTLQPQDLFQPPKEKTDLPEVQLKSAQESLIAKGDWSYAPFEFINENGEPDGFNIDILQRIAKIMNLKIDIRLGPWEKMRKEIEQGEIDILCGMYKTKERDILVDFTIPHFIASYGVFIPKNSDIQSVEDIKDSRIVVQEADVGHDYIMRHNLGSSVVIRNNWRDLFSAVTSGEADCAVLGMAQGTREIQEKNIKNIRVITEPLFQRHYCIAVKEGDAELLAQLNEGLNLLKTSGEYDRIYEKWFGIYEPRDPLTTAAIRFLLIVAVVLGGLLFLSLFWSHSLRIKVNERTKELRQSNREANKSRKNAEEANMAKTQFLASVSHELRTPLHGIIGIAGLLEKTGLNPEQLNFLKMIQNSSEQLFRLISDLLDVSRISSGKFSLQPSLFSLDELSSRLEPLLRSLAGEKGLDFSYTQSSTATYLHGDKERLAQIIINLTNNAVKNTESGNIAVATDYEAGTLTITVEDTGRGIPKELQSKVFSSFVQLNRDDPGLGLGLSIVQSLTTMMKGTIELHSKEGEGTTFHIRIPIEETEKGPGRENTPLESEKEPPIEAGKHTGAKRILVVEDETISQLYMEQTLRRAGCNPEAAVNGEAAVEKATTERFDLILMDVSVPKINGLEATKLIRDHEAASGKRHTPIIAMTAHASAEYRDKCLSAGMDGFLPKPFKEHNLWKEIDRLLAE